MRKDSICVYIENEAQYIEARRLLNKYGECINPMFDTGLSEIKSLNYLQLGRILNGIKGWWMARVYKSENFTQITLPELEVILKDKTEYSLLQMLKRVHNELDCAEFCSYGGIPDLVDEIEVLIKKTEREYEIYKESTS